MAMSSTSLHDPYLRIIPITSGFQASPSFLAKHSTWLLLRTLILNTTRARRRTGENK
ncbi:hypothetical protein JI435_414010 [Parastagonospora nodorum SN15]|uniref:Uncharacterized protein n=1 Tax=Phaeosphaeria nodorum (strain SN15 / ATCC MYA-4574 / FGSC 10173) TaxID=321614 RepID=A0A7U2I569_PHANO|nr:hypothetical protein JI435_414010 [Parastagonospora nodorum SN15]